ncbi:hypothetical protein KSP40_PGU019260 [Platanthera guangdongensis]|uniref:Uncharacterized protein n=1 Tax=Platanthera guangdongensis TaxID=2320717 RepID=A0ABR2M7X2_9ASPA
MSTLIAVIKDVVFVKNCDTIDQHVPEIKKIEGKKLFVYKILLHFVYKSISEKYVLMFVLNFSGVMEDCSSCCEEWMHCC